MHTHTTEVNLLHRLVYGVTCVSCGAAAAAAAGAATAAAEAARVACDGGSIEN